MQTNKLILASGSPRRKTLLETLGIPFDVEVSGVSEEFNKHLDSRQTVVVLATRKAMAISIRHTEEFVIGCDTIISLDGKIVGKPSDSEDAFSILSALRGRTHEVLSGLAVVDSSTLKTVADVVVTEVTMRNYTDNEIRDYIATGEPLDKAGAYAIQGSGRALVEKYVGDLNNVVGLPMELLKSILQTVLPDAIK